MQISRAAPSLGATLSGAGGRLRVAFPVPAAADLSSIPDGIDSEERCPTREESCLRRVDVCWKALIAYLVVESLAHLVLERHRLKLDEDAALLKRWNISREQAAMELLGGAKGNPFITLFCYWTARSQRV